MKRTLYNALLSALASEHRLILSEWRALILLRRATFTLPDDQRRWTTLPQSTLDIRPLLRRMEQRGDIALLHGLTGIYRVTTPYAPSRAIDEQEVAMELHPYSTVSHLSAMVFHNLTDQFPNGLFLTIANGVGNDLLPIGTTGDDWEGLNHISGRKVQSILGRPVHWTGIVPKWFFGIHEYRRAGYPVRVTTVERTLLDGLREPNLCGGMENVLRGWAHAKDWLNLTTLNNDLARFDLGILYQRVGYILDELGIADPRIDEWTRFATRGGSSKLVANAPYSPNYSERWSLSINSPISALTDPYS